MVIATKGGLTRQGLNQWSLCGQPNYLRQCVEMSLRRLQVERIDLYYLHRIDPAVPLEDQLGVLRDMQAEGKIHHVGLSKVTVEQLRTASELVDVAAVQNKYNVANQTSEDVLRHCEATGISFVPYAPLATGRLAEPRSVLHELAAEYGATPAQLALAWLLHRSPVVAPIPGTGSSTRLYENLAAEQISLTTEAMTAIELAATGQKPEGGQNESQALF
ncbi:aldo/keto reductase [Streptomyces sp. G44]|uniref:aldo/keto reductase n=1 Tax=Streptomyces sp. G44 TaxID=2807632 RepID=UPI0023BA50F5|nr:aldo/keto reductase [Streptomyces sp. G44]